MEIGIGLPNAVRGAHGPALIEFAREADQAGFSSLGTIDRVVYDKEAGADEFVFFPASSDPGQVTLLHEALG